jgi:cytochrome c biogenesis protein CcmG/thiol:disulfide interchange protein DsbE
MSTQDEPNQDSATPPPAGDDAPLPEPRLSRSAAWMAMGSVALALGLLWAASDLSDPHIDDPALAAYDEYADEEAEGKRAPLNFTVKDMNGASINFASYRGKIILLNFWATWCGPCKHEIPAFVELYNAYKDKGFVVLGLSTDDKPEQLKKFAQQMNMTYPVLVGSDRSDIIDEAYGPMWGIPVSFLIMKDGTICHKFMGLVTKEQLERELKALLAI